MARVPRIQIRGVGQRRPYYTINYQRKRHYLGTDVGEAHRRASEILGQDPRAYPKTFC